VILKLDNEEAMCLQSELDGTKTVEVQVNVTFTNEKGETYASTRIVKMRLKKE
jgi:hypothetical protein